MKKLLLLLIIAVMSLAATNQTAKIDGNWTQSFVVRDTQKHIGYITHTPEKITIGNCGFSQINIEGGNYIDELYIEDLHLKTNSTLEEFVKGINDSNLEIIRLFYAGSYY